MTESVEVLELERLRAYEQAAVKDVSETPKQQPSGFWANITMEPALAGAMVAIFMAQTSLQNLYLRTACSVDLNFPETVCHKGVGEAFRDAELASQKLVSTINVSRGFVGALISTVVLLFLGPWSDCSGRRKPLIIVSLLGMCVTTFNVLMILTFPIFSTTWVLYLVQIPMSLGGNMGLLLAAGFSYIGDVCHTTGRNVTMTMGKNRAVIQCSAVLGSVAGPLLYRYVGFYGVFPLVFFLQVSALIFVIQKVKDTNINVENKVSLLDVRLPYNAVCCLLRPREGHRRKIVLLMTLVAIADKMILSAEVLLWYMYARNKYHWDDILFGSYISFRNVTGFIGTLIILRLFKAKLKLSDEIVGVMSTISLIVATSCLVATKSTIFVFIVSLIGIFGQGSQVVQRPIVNKQIQPNEQGKIYSVIGGIEQAFQTAISPLFSLLYSITAKSAPDAWLIPCICLACMQMSSFAFAFYFNTRPSMAPDDPKIVVPGETSIYKPDATTPLISDGISRKAISIHETEIEANVQEVEVKQIHDSNGKKHESKDVSKNGPDGATFDTGERQSKYSNTDAIKEDIDVNRTPN